MSLPYFDYKTKSQRSWRQKVAAKRHAYKRQPFFNSSPKKGWGAFFKKLILKKEFSIIPVIGDCRTLGDRDIEFEKKVIQMS